MYLASLIHQGQGLRFPCYDQTEKVHCRPESAINLNQQLVSRQLLKKNILSVSCTVGPVIHSGDPRQWTPLLRAVN